MKTENSILQTLAYFDMFHHPLTLEEIRNFCSVALLPGAVKAAVAVLIEEKLVYDLGNYYSLRNDFSLVDRRKKGNAKALEMIPTALRIGNFLQHFPFVRAVGISGSLSKGYADEHSDIDFFIITEKKRLWIARTLLHVFKKLSYPVGKQHWFCMNYFIDEDALTIAEQNVFTATEIFTLIPVSGKSTLDAFYVSNGWARKYFPNQFIKKDCVQKDSKTHWIKRMAEKILNHSFANRLDDYLLRISSARWTKKENRHQLNMKGNPMGLKTEKHCARPNPGQLQKKLLALFQEKIQELPTGCHKPRKAAKVFSEMK